ncbi:hypothetical protein ACHAW6_005695 [Cyclotella cf. meneghiniana]
MTLCREFDSAIQTFYMKDYLWVPDEVDLGNINELHHHVHGVDDKLPKGMGRILSRKRKQPLNRAGGYF